MGVAAAGTPVDGRGVPAALPELPEAPHAVDDAIVSDEREVAVRPGANAVAGSVLEIVELSDMRWRARCNASCFWRSNMEAREPAAAIPAASVRATGSEASDANRSWPAAAHGEGTTRNGGKTDEKISPPTGKHRAGTCTHTVAGAYPRVQRLRRWAVDEKRPCYATQKRARRDCSARQVICELCPPFTSRVARAWTTGEVSATRRSARGPSWRETSSCVQLDKRLLR
ncbi:MAG: hypothetical protein EOO65_01920 [Methanosarcinales archaeon]|nr:MAG: hypothetical protein EOO65_01920 [Methanosarcinales archaeon]